MAILTREVVWDQMQRLHLRSKFKNNTLAELAVVTDEYLEDLEDMGWSDENFLAAVRMARKRVEGIPSISELVSCHEEICRNPPRKPVAGLIAEESLVKTPEMIAAGKRNCAIVKIMLDNGISAEEAEKMYSAREERPMLRVVGE